MSVYLVYGPPGAGKRSIIAAAAQQVQASAYYVFAKADVDPYEKATPDPTHENIVSTEEFDRKKAANAYVCEWSYAKSRYAIPESYFTQLSYRSKLIVNAPYSAISAIEARCKQQYQLQLIHITAPPDLLSSRLRNLPDKRDSKNALRLLKTNATDMETANIPTDGVITINNDGTLSTAVTTFVQTLGFNPNTDVKQPGQFNLETCTPQEYLQRTVFPYLNEALTLIDRERPADPIEYLGLYLYECASVDRECIASLNATHELREKLREQLKSEYSITGRV